MYTQNKTAEKQNIIISFETIHLSTLNEQEKTPNTTTNKQKSDILQKV
jgi:hypothetical protein